MRTLVAAVVLVAILALWLRYGDGRAPLDFFDHLRERGWSWPLAVVAVAVVSGMLVLAVMVLSDGPMPAW
jgi:hypothetical protein